jgi:hypothetical protein
MAALDAGRSAEYHALWVESVKLSVTADVLPQAEEAAIEAVRSSLCR